ncbi:6-O-methylguanine DNA methyltransferase, DNA binding domain [Stieleria neptunia]|uniref:6-O-methylguanine DNA methyltransferase, DNA binding domain n=1 Tax=Stieleria neptunia TaxID=2527979 RepID=A0A518HK09_9BACT|nr:MGMT family protein [Stieleria neptunia]QDV41186.1 6-O-methylguanine DNA methyltransferase, DNA binding domain [Stieleria neptunia]
MLTEFQLKMENAVLRLRPGEVVSFGDIAAAAGRPRASRAAGRLLAQSLDTLPWWRVVYSDGHLPPCNPSVQAERLAEEGVQLNGSRVVASPLGRFKKSQGS